MCLSPFFILALPRLHSVCQGYAWLFLGFLAHIRAMPGLCSVTQCLSGLYYAFAVRTVRGFAMPLLCGGLLCHRCISPYRVLFSCAGCPVRLCIATFCRCHAKQFIATALPDIGQSHSAVAALFHALLHRDELCRRSALIGSSRTCYAIAAPCVMSPCP